MTEQKDHIGDATKMITAVDWLVDQLKKGEFINDPDELVKQANELQKEQFKLFFLFFRENGEKYLGLTIEQFVDVFWEKMFFNASKR